MNNSPIQQEEKVKSWQVALEAHVLPLTGQQLRGDISKPAAPLDGTSDSELINGKETPGVFFQKAN